MANSARRAEGKGSVIFVDVPEVRLVFLGISLTTSQPPTDHWLSRLGYNVLSQIG